MGGGQVRLRINNSLCGIHVFHRFKISLEFNKFVDDQISDSVNLVLRGSFHAE